MGCIPTKALLFNAEIWDHLKDAKEYGIEGVGERKLNWNAVQERKTKVVRQTRQRPSVPDAQEQSRDGEGLRQAHRPAQNGVHTIEVKDGARFRRSKRRT